MITLEMQNGEPVARQVLESPVVYLDHWAFMDIADLRENADAFVSALSDRAGTLAISWLNIAEFGRMTNAKHAENAGDLLDRVSPRLFFLEPNVFEVLKRENHLLNGGDKIAPHSDGQFLQTFVGHDSGSVNPLSGANFVSAARTTDYEGFLEEMSGTIREQVSTLREQYISDREYQKKVTTPTLGPDMPNGTRYILREVLNLSIKDRGFEFDGNHAIDLVHTVVPVSYCDYVLLDGPWQTRVEQAANRLRKAGHGFSVSEVFSGRRKGLKRFLDALRGDDF